MEPGVQNWIWILILIIVLLVLILIFLCIRYRNLILSFFWKCYQPLHSTQAQGESSGPRCTVECYGQGKIHEDILKQMDITICREDPGIPYILFVYKISRDIEDLRNALRWVQMNRGKQREGICAVILLEKVSNKQDKPIEVDHQGVFDEKTVVVRILWEEQWSGAKVQKGPRNKSAMEKVNRSIRVREHN